MHQFHLRLVSDAALAALAFAFGEVNVKVFNEGRCEGVRIDSGADCPAQASGRILALKGAMCDARAMVAMTRLACCTQCHVGRKACRLLNRLLRFGMFATVLALVDLPALVPLQLR